MARLSIFWWMGVQEATRGPGDVLGSWAVVSGIGWLLIVPSRIVFGQLQLLICVPKLSLPNGSELFVKLGWINRLFKGRWDVDAWKPFIEWDDTRSHGISPRGRSHRATRQESRFAGRCRRVTVAEYCRSAGRNHG